MMLKNKALLLCMFSLITFYSCNNDHENLWNEAEQLYSENDHEKSIKTLHQIINKYPNSDYSAKAKYLLADIFLNEYNEYNIAIEYFNRVILEHPYHELSKKSLFTLGYIYGNYLDAYTDAFNTYTAFIKNYPNDPLVSSAEYEINNLKPFLDTIKKLINN